MPQTLTETALVTIAVAVSVQAIVGVSLGIGSWLALRRLQITLKAESAALQGRLDEDRESAWYECQAIDDYVGEPHAIGVWLRSVGLRD